ncbi:MAG: hypothetical protein J5527_06995 [Treponema sp.]|nr:hypothetical protein [Treponema sp.]
MKNILSDSNKMFLSNSSIEELHLSIRSLNVLRNNNINTIGELVELVKTDRNKILSFKNFGKQSAEEIFSIVDNISIIETNNDVYLDYISNYDFSKRALTVFANKNIKTISELRKYTIPEIKQWKNIGKQTLDEIIDVLSSIPNNQNYSLNNFTFNDEVKDIEKSSIEQILNILILKIDNEKKILTTEKSIKDYNFSSRALNILLNKNINTISDLRKHSLNEIRCWRNMGNKTFNEIIDVLSLNEEIVKEEINIGFCISELEYKFYKLSIVKYNKIINQFYDNETQFMELLDKENKLILNSKSDIDILLVSNSFRKSKIFSFCKSFVDDYNLFFSRSKQTIASILMCIINCVEISKISTEDIIKYQSSFTRLVFSDDDCIQQIQFTIMNYLNKCLEPVDESELIMIFPDFIKKTGIVSYILINMKKEGLIKQLKNTYESVLPSVTSFIKDIKEKKIKDILIRKVINGQTLEEIGQTYGVSRERIRQLINKNFIQRITNLVFDEDKYANIYKKYKFTKEQARIIFGEVASNYFQIKYTSENINLEDCLDDKTIPINIRRKIRTKIIYADYIYVGNQYVKKYRPELYRYYIKRYCKGDIEIDVFIKNYNDFWEKQGLPKELYGIDSRIIQNRVSHISNTLYKYPRSFRFYDFEQYDFTELLETLNLEQYVDVLISTAKFFKSYPKLMKKYDIHDEYELHNLLRYLLEKKNNITFHRMPGIEFGKADVEKQVIELLNENAPISPEKLSQLYENNYGFQADSVRGSLFNFIRKYLHKGIYTIDLPHLEDIEFNFLKQQLTDDFYTISDVKAIFLRDYKNVEHINPMTLKELGFLVNENYIIKAEYGSAANYFKYLLTKDEKISLKDINIEIKCLQNFYAVLTDLLNNYDLLEYEKGSYININKLMAIGINKEDFVDFCKGVSKLELPEYFALKQVKESGFYNKLFDLGFEDLFYECILARNDILFSSQHLSGKIIFSKGNKDITWFSLIEDIISENGMDIYKLSDKLYKDFGIKADKSYILSRIYDSDLYYDKIMEKIYRSYDDYFEEI